MMELVAEARVATALECCYRAGGEKGRPAARVQDKRGQRQVGVAVVQNIMVRKEVAA